MLAIVLCDPACPFDIEAEVRFPEEDDDQIELDCQVQQPQSADKCGCLEIHPAENSHRQECCIKSGVRRAESHQH